MRTADLERMLPSYARHAARRAIEMEGLADYIRELGLDPLVAEAAARRIRRIAAALPAPAGDAALSAQEMLRVVARAPERRDSLQPHSSPDETSPGLPD